MNTYQTAYSIAKAQYDTINTEYARRVTNLDWDGDFDAAFEQDEAIRTELKVGEAFKALRDAETALINWAHETVKREQPLYTKHAGDLRTVFEAVNTRPAIRDRVLDLALRLA